MSGGDGKFNYGSVRALSYVLGLGLALTLPSMSLAAEPRPVFDISRGPLNASSRIVGLGGAYTGLGEGIDGYFRNPASLANRYAQSTNYFDYDILLDYVIDAKAVDIDNDDNRHVDGGTFTEANLGFSLNFGHFGAGVVFVPSTYSLTEGDFTLRATRFDLLAGGAFAFKDGEWIAGVGFGLRGLTLETETRAGTPLQSVSYISAAADLGLLWRSPKIPLRLGLAARIPVSVGRSIEALPETMLGRALPGGVNFPWRIAVGGAFMYSLGDRVFNRPIRGAQWCNDLEMTDRRYIMVTADIVVDGPTSGPGGAGAGSAVNLEGWVSGSPRTSGDYATLSWHVGVEAEVAHDRLRLRVGAYSEPSRINDDVWGRIGRVHWTGGAEVRLFDLWIFRLKASVTFDIANRWKNIVLGIGFWS